MELVKDNVRKQMENVQVCVSEASMYFTSEKYMDKRKFNIIYFTCKGGRKKKKRPDELPLPKSYVKKEFKTVS